jgi:hypothetical protein
LINIEEAPRGDIALQDPPDRGHFQPKGDQISFPPPASFERKALESLHNHAIFQRNEKP